MSVACRPDPAAGRDTNDHDDVRHRICATGEPERRSKNSRSYSVPPCALWQPKIAHCHKRLGAHASSLPRFWRHVCCGAQKPHQFTFVPNPARGAADAWRCQVGKRRSTPPLLGRSICEWLVWERVVGRTACRRPERNQEKNPSVGALRQPILDAVEPCSVLMSGCRCASI